MKILNGKRLLKFLASHKILGLLLDLVLFPLILLMYIIKYFHVTDIDKHLPKQNKPPILLVHGSGSNEAQWLISSIYLKHKYDIYMVQLNTIPADHTAGLDDMSLILDSKITEILKVNNQKLTLVGHSMGGLICAAAAKKYHTYIKRIITINSPWNGASMLHNVMFETKRHHQMLPNSAFTLECQTNMNVYNVDLTVVYNEYDMQVHACDAVPTHVQQFKTVNYGCGHTNVILHKKLWKLLELI